VFGGLFDESYLEEALKLRAEKKEEWIEHLAAVKASGGDGDDDLPF
jgi:hypothetical protein